MNTKTTKRALFSSVLAIVLCLAMLIGTTFAWFTDTASTGVNKIQAGNLDIDIVDGSGKSLDGKTLSFKNVNGETDILWEPGCTYLTEGFQIKNDGNLALKYKLEINGTDGDSDLLKVIKFSVVKSTEKDAESVSLDTFEGHLTTADNGNLSDMLYIRAHMEETAGNEYMDMAIDGIAITVYATQDTVESDSFGTDYDENATYPATVSAIKAEYGVDGLKMPSGVEIAADTNYSTTQGKGHYIITLKDEEAFVYFTQVFDRKAACVAREKALDEGTVTKFEGEHVINALNMWYYSGTATIKLESDVDLAGANVKPFTFGGNTFVFDGQGHTIKNAKLTNASGFFANHTAVSNVTLDNIHVTATGLEYAGVVEGYSNKNITDVTVKNCSVTGGKYTGAIVGDCYANVTGCTVENTVVSGQYKVGGIAGYVCNEDAGVEQAITGNKLTNVTVKGENILSGKTLVIGKIVGNWNHLNSGNATCTNNTVNNVTGAETNIGVIYGTVTEE